MKTIHSVCRAETDEELDKIWGCSSAGRAPALQAGGQEFDSPHLHQIPEYVSININRCTLKTKQYEYDDREIRG